MTPKTPSGIEYTPFNKKAPSIKELNDMEKNYNHIQAHYKAIETQNETLQKDLFIANKALELAIADYKVEENKIELTDQQMKAEVKDYKQQAAIALGLV